MDGAGGRARDRGGGGVAAAAAAAGLLQIPQADFGLRLVLVPVCQATRDAPQINKANNVNNNNNNEGCSYQEVGLLSKETM